MQSAISGSLDGGSERRCAKAKFTSAGQAGSWVKRAAFYLPLTHERGV